MRGALLILFLCLPAPGRSTEKCSDLWRRSPSAILAHLSDVSSWEGVKAIQMMADLVPIEPVRVDHLPPPQTEEYGIAQEIAP